MRRVFAFSLVVLAFAGGLRLPGLPWWGLTAGLIVLGALAWRISQCPHAQPLALLPATTDLKGNRLEPRWYCDTCGRTWLAHFEKEHTPVIRFSGYDESKAVRSARRASALADRQRAAALERAGLKPSKRLRLASETPGADRADVLPIDRGSRLARLG